MASKSGPQQGPRKPLNLNASVVASSAKQNNRSSPGPSSNSPSGKGSNTKTVNANVAGKPVQGVQQPQQKNGTGNSSSNKLEKPIETPKTQNGVDKLNTKEKQQQNGNQEVKSTAQDSPKPKEPSVKQDTQENIPKKNKEPQKAAEKQENNVEPKKGTEPQSRRIEIALSAHSEELKKETESKKKGEEIKKKVEVKKQNEDQTKNVDEDKKKNEQAKKTDEEPKKKVDEAKKKPEQVKKEIEVQHIGQPAKVAEAKSTASSPSTRRAIAEQKKSTPHKKPFTTHNVLPAEIMLEEHMEIDIDEPFGQEEIEAIVADAKAHAALHNPNATSTPGKPFERKRESRTIDVGTPLDRNNCPSSYSAISGRRSIRAINEYTPSRFTSNSQFRESYRRINTELDTSLASNSSMNVTVGSEVPNNSSFSFFGRGRKRERENVNVGPSTTDVLSPPKRTRLDVYGFLKNCSSPLQLLRSRFSKATLESTSSTPLRVTLDDLKPELEIVSDIIDDDSPNGDTQETTTNDKAEASIEVVEDANKAEKLCESTAAGIANDGDNFSDAEPQTVSAGGSPVDKKERCAIM